MGRVNAKLSKSFTFELYEQEMQHVYRSTDCKGSPVTKESISKISKQRIRPWAARGSVRLDRNCDVGSASPSSMTFSAVDSTHSCVASPTLLFDRTGQAAQSSCTEQQIVTTSWKNLSTTKVLLEQGEYASVSATH